MQAERFIIAGRYNYTVAVGISAVYITIWPSGSEAVTSRHSTDLV